MSYGVIKLNLQLILKQLIHLYVLLEAAYSALHHIISWLGYQTDVMTVIYIAL